MVPQPPLAGSQTLADPPLSASCLLGLAGLIRQVAAAPITPGVVETLRRQQGPQAAAMVVAIASEQPRAQSKFGCGTWMVTAQAIRQATDRVVARYKAGLLGDRVVFDLCGGIGGDAIELARRGRVATIDYDPQLTAMAAANLRLDRVGAESGLAQSTAPNASAAPGVPASTTRSGLAICADVTRYPIPGSVAVHIDPDRRPEQRRTVRPSDYLPSLQFVAGLVSAREAALVKLAPAAALQQDANGLELARRHHRQWISFDFSVREQTLLCGDVIAAAGLAAGGRSAVRLIRDGCLQRFAIDAPTAARLDDIDRSVAATEVPQTWIFDFDPAVRGGGLSAALALAQRLTAVGGPAGFFTNDTLPEDRSLMQCFETLWIGPADRKQIKRELRRSDRILQSVKVRGSGHDPAELQRLLRREKQRLQEPEKVQRPKPGEAAGDAADSRAGGTSTAPAVTLLIGRHRRGVYAVIGRKLP